MIIIWIIKYSIIFESLIISFLFWMGCKVSHVLDDRHVDISSPSDFTIAIDKDHPSNGKLRQHTSRMTPLFLALKIHVETAQKLSIEDGSHEATIFEKIVADERPKNVDFGVGEIKIAAIHLAAFNNQIKAVELLLKAGADVNLRTQADATPLHFACNFRPDENEPKSRAEMAKLLLSHGADAKMLDFEGMTPLHRAVFSPGFYGVEKCNHNFDVVVALLNSDSVSEFINAPVHHDSQVATALLLAVRSQSTEIVKALLGIPQLDVNAADECGKSALHYAVQELQWDIAQEILKREDANVLMKNAQGYSPYDFIQTNYQAIRGDLPLPGEDGFQPVSNPQHHNPGFGAPRSPLRAKQDREIQIIFALMQVHASYSPSSQSEQIFSLADFVPSPDRRTEEHDEMSSNGSSGNDKTVSLQDPNEPGSKRI